MAAVEDAPSGVRTHVMTVRAHVREIEEAIGQLSKESDCTTQILLLFNVGCKVDTLKKFVQEKKVACDSGLLSRQEFDQLETEFRRVREWASHSISPMFDLFFKEYRFQVANSRDLMDKVFHIRHEVYCRELGFEPIKTDNKEVDEYDHMSRHILLVRANEPERGIGCIRVVFLSPSSVEGNCTDQLPLMKLCKTFYSHNPAQMEREAVCEISRLSLLSEYRTIRSTDPIVRLVTLALPLAAYVVGIHHNVKYAYQLCEPPLAKYLSRSLGSPLTPIGEPVEFHGTRVPTLVLPRSSVDEMDLIPYTFFRLLHQHIYGPYTTEPATQSASPPISAKL